MALSYLPVDRDQLFLLPLSMRDWLSEAPPRRGTSVATFVGTSDANRNGLLAADRRDQLVAQRCAVQPVAVETCARSGLRADLVLIEGDPRADITNTRAIVGVWKGGRIFDRDAYQTGVTSTHG